MSTTTATQLRDLPKVNLLPPEIGERKKLRLVQAGVVLGVVAAVGGVAFVDMGAQHKVTNARHDLDTQQTQQATLNKQLADLRDVQQTAAQLQASEALLTRAMATEVTWSNYLADFGTSLPKTSWLTNMTLTESVSPGSLASPSDAGGSVGSVTMQGVALKYPNLADTLDVLAQEHGLSDVYFSTAKEQYIGPTKVIQFQSSSNLTQAALSGRCATPGSC